MDTDEAKRVIIQARVMLYSGIIFAWLPLILAVALPISWVYPIVSVSAGLLGVVFSLISRQICMKYAHTITYNLIVKQNRLSGCIFISTLILLCAYIGLNESGKLFTNLYALLVLLSVFIGTLSLFMIITYKTLWNSIIEQAEAVLNPDIELVYTGTAGEGAATVGAQSTKPPPYEPEQLPAYVSI